MGISIAWHHCGGPGAEHWDIQSVPLGGGSQKDTSGFVLFKELVSDLQTAERKDTVPRASPLQHALKGSISVIPSEHDKMLNDLRDCARIAKEIVPDTRDMPLDSLEDIPELPEPMGQSIYEFRKMIWRRARAALQAIY